MSDEIVKPEAKSEQLAVVIEGLRAREALAMQCIMAGGTMADAAEAAGVSRRTLYYWLEAGRALCEAVAVWKQDLATTARTRLLMMTDMATQNILNALKRGDARLAMQLVQKMGILDAPPTGPTRVEAATEAVTAKRQEGHRSQTVHVRAASFVEQWTEVDERTTSDERPKAKLSDVRNCEAGDGAARDAGAAGCEDGAVGGDERGDRDGGGAEAEGAAADSEAIGAGEGDSAV
jgi:AcrR family transcriptional regulator